MLKHVREKHPEARGMYIGDKDDRVDKDDRMEEVIDVKTDPRSAIEYTPEPMGQVRSQIQITQGPTGLSTTVTSTSETPPTSTAPSDRMMSHFQPATNQAPLHMPNMSRSQNISQQQSPMTIPMDH